MVMRRSSAGVALAVDDAHAGTHCMPQGNKSLLAGHRDILH